MIQQLFLQLELYIQLVMLDMGFSFNGSPMSSLGLWGSNQIEQQRGLNYLNSTQWQGPNTPTLSEPLPTDYGITDYSQEFFNKTSFLPSQFLAVQALKSSDNPNSQLLGTLEEDKFLSNINKPLGLQQISHVGERTFEDKFNNSAFGKYNKGINFALDTANQFLTGMVGDKMFGGPKGNIVKGIDQVWNTGAEIAGQFGPIGKVAQLGMKGLSVLNKGVNAALGSSALDNMSTLDAALNNHLTGWNVGLVNALGGSNASTITKDDDVYAALSSSYGSSYGKIDDALLLSGKRFGAFSRGKLRRANQKLLEANLEQLAMTDIADDTADRFTIRNSMSAINGNRRAYDLNGSYDQSAVFRGQKGLNIKNILKAKEIVNKFQKGGSINISKYTLDELPLTYILSEFRDGGTLPRTIEQLIEYAKQQNPRFIQRLSEEPKGIEFIDDEGKQSRGSHYLESRGEYVIPRIQEIDGELKFLNPQDAINRAIETGNYLKMLPEEAIIFAEQYKQGWPEFFQKFEVGGKFNVIPEGALHARLHHMDNADNLTKKGIPVVSEKENGELEQQAEIERDEIIYRISVTNKLEELCKVFYSNDSSEQEKDDAALEAGKLLVYETLHNTQDNTGLINNIQ